MPTARTIAIGDIHGCADALATLIDAIDPQADDLIITLGDYVDRGDNSRGVIDQLIALKQRCQTVHLRGNHELMMMDAIETPQSRPFWMQCGGRETLDSYGPSIDDIPEAHLMFIEALLPFYETTDYFFIHANYEANRALDKQRPNVMYWEHLHPSAVPARHVSGKTAIVGHTPQISGDILDLDHIVCIDTCCFGGGLLTAMEVETRQLWQADIAGQLRD